MALRVPEIHFGAILEDLALWLEEQKAKCWDPRFAPRRDTP